MQEEHRSAGDGPEVRHVSHEVQSLLDLMARALTAGDGAAVAALWAVPALLLGDDEIHAVGSREEIAAFFGGSREQFNARGIVDTRGEILRMVWLTDRIATVDVRWPQLDADDHEIGADVSTYTLRRDDAGVLKIQAAVMRGASQPH